MKRIPGDNPEGSNRDSGSHPDGFNNAASAKEGGTGCVSLGAPDNEFDQFDLDEAEPADELEHRQRARAPEAGHDDTQEPAAIRERNVAQVREVLGWKFRK